MLTSYIISSNQDIPRLDNVMVFPLVEVVVSQDECIRHQSFNTFTNMNLHWGLSSHFLLHSDILWFNELGSCTLPSQSCPLSHLIFSIKCILYTESEKHDEVRKILSYSINFVIVVMLLTLKNKLDKYLPSWHVDGSVDDFLNSFVVTEFYMKIVSSFLNSLLLNKMAEKLTSKLFLLTFYVGNLKRRAEISLK